VNLLFFLLLVEQSGAPIPIVIGYFIRGICFSGFILYTACFLTYSIQKIIPPDSYRESIGNGGRKKALKGRDISAQGAALCMDNIHQYIEAL